METRLEPMKPRGRMFDEFRKNHHMKLIYGTTCILTSIGYVERGVSIFIIMIETIFTNRKAGGGFSEAVNEALDLMRKTHNRLKKSALELHSRRNNQGQKMIMLFFSKKKKRVVSTNSFRSIFLLHQ